MPNGDTTVFDESLDIKTDEESEDLLPADTAEQKDENITGDDPVTGKVAELTPQQLSAQKQEDVWVANILAGKRDIDDPKLPKWLKGRVEARISAPIVKEKEPEISVIVQKEIQKIEERKQFEELKKSIPKLTKEQGEFLKQKFQEFKPLGEAKALKVALDYLNLGSYNEEKQKKGVAKVKLSLPPSGIPLDSSSDGIDELDLAKDNKKWKEYLKKKVNQSD